MIRSGITILFACLLALSMAAQDGQNKWVDSIYNNMSQQERIGQLIMIRAFSKDNVKEINHVKKLIKDYKVGGVCFFQGSPVMQAELTNEYQKLSKTPLLMSIDGEWGLGMRFKDQAMSFPKQLMLGAIQDNNLIYEMGMHIGEHCKRIGLHINFAPVVDVNNNPNNPVINDRSFGEDKYNVIAKSYSYMKGLQDVGVMACAKHFPGHGDTDVDSHLDLPVIHHSMARMDSLELVPFKAMISQGIGSVMVAHLHIPAIDDRPNRPTTLSHNAITGILRNDMLFNGLVFTDAMEMKGVTKHFKKGHADAEAFLAGADIILLPEDVGAAVKSIEKYIKDGLISEKRLAESVKRILRAKFSLGLTHHQSLELDGLSQDINNKHSLALKEELIENAITLVKDDLNMVPLMSLKNKRIATLAIGATKQTIFQKRVQKYTSTRDYFTSKNVSEEQQNNILKNLENSDIVLISLHDMSKYGKKNFGVTQSSIDLINKIAEKKKVILTVFGSPYALKFFENIPSIIMSYNDESLVQDITAQSLFGANAFKGKLPVSASGVMQYGRGLYRGAVQRLGFSVPERVGLESEKLKEIDELAQEMIKKKGTPGAQVLVAKNNKIVYEKAFGHFTYNGKRAVRKEDIYDVASVTKIAAATISLMKLYDEGKFDLDAPILRYLKETNTSNKATLKMRDILAHHARLIPWIPFYKSTVTDKKKEFKPLSKYYSLSSKNNYTTPVTEKLYMRNDYQDSLWQEIYDSELRTKTGYRYSDLGFLMFTKIIHELSGIPLDQYAYQSFYEPLGLRRTGYNPLYRIDQTEIAPSEKDDYFRDQVVQGTVHDMAAAMLGGVSGHAGLFTNAYELSVIMQMLLNGGSYGGQQFLKPETIKMFTTRYPKSTRRGLGFDMKELNNYNTNNICDEASDKAFGHLGFTGISAFVDPKYDLVIVILANRTYPSMDNRVYIRNNYRPKIQSAVYKALSKENILP